MFRVICIFFAAVAAFSGNLRAQFSPGDLSLAHRELEGTDKCARCHEVGKEISGRKCLTCHPEIRASIESRHGMHASKSSDACIVCHKEHLGRNAQTLKFDRSSFDHTQTGCVLEGGHRGIPCEQCHSRKNLADKSVVELGSRTGRKTFLGLNQRCTSCHEDRHKGEVSAECHSCHTYDRWAPAKNLDHSITRFALLGKHASVKCTDCHKGIATGANPATVSFATKSYADCTPCHASPHGRKFGSRECSSCHVPQSWSRVALAAFDHTMTGYRLVGRHAAAKCQGCHKERLTDIGAKPRRLRHDNCIDCHEDYHRSELPSRYANDCRTCHTEEGFRPSTFTVARHSESRFVLTGGHAAIPCAGCHVKGPGTSATFRFGDLRCISCHRDEHQGQFSGLMGDKSCDICHSTMSWMISSFKHENASFSLSGKHAAVPCSSCHTKQTIRGTVTIRYNGMPGECGSCHKDQHAGQFASNGETDCRRCHSVAGWRRVTFDHNRQTSFALTGAHSRVECSACHREKESQSGRVRSFKGLSRSCASCHAKGRQL